MILKNNGNKRFGLIVGIILNSLIVQGQKIDSKDLTKYVDPFIGVQKNWNDGCVFPGASLPFGMVRLGPDMDLYTAESGYLEGKDILGFSHIHCSGTGGVPSYGNILTMATIGKPDLKNQASPWINEKARPGYYGVHLTKHDIDAELAVTRHAGFHQYTFTGTDSATVFFDAGSFTGLDDTYSEPQILVGSEVQIISDREIQGYNRIREGWTGFGAFSVYFYATFETPCHSYGTWKSGKIYDGRREQYDSGEKTGAYFTFRTQNGQKIKLKVGISYVSCLKAKENSEKEIKDWNFDQVVAEADNTWNKILNTIIVESGDEDDLKTFYTALFHANMMPTDKTGENPGWISPEPYYDDFYCLEDMFRTQLPLVNLLMPSKGLEIVRSLIDIYRYDKYMPDSRIGGDNGLTQGGSNADVVLADAFVKGLKGIDYEDGYKAMVKDAEVPPGDDELKHGRRGIPDYNTKGYITTKYGGAGSRTLEYSYNDWCIAQVAKGLGKMDDYKKYRERASNWENLWNPDISSMGAKGFIWPRNAEGNWTDSLYERLGVDLKAPMGPVKFDPLTFGIGGFTSFLYESHSWEYSFYVPQDIKKLIEKCGGNNFFVARLDTFFLKGLFNVGNEFGFLTPYLYIWAGRPDKTAYQVNYIRRRYFNSSRRGLPGNDDSGAMSSLYVFDALGLFPVAGQDFYLITGPLFGKTEIRLENGNSFKIIAQNLNKTNIYIQSARLNGKALNRAWLRHQDLVMGGSLELVMGPEPSGWGRSEVPPSLSDNN